MCDSDCVSARSYEEEVSARVLLKDRIRQIIGLVNGGHDETEAQLRERLAYIGDLLLQALEQDSNEFDERLQRWSLMLNSRSDFIK